MDKYPEINFAINNKFKQLMTDKLNPWMFFNTGKMAPIVDFYGRAMQYSGVVGFEGSPREVFWGGFIEPFLESIFVWAFEFVLSHAQKRNLDRKELILYARECLVNGIHLTYSRMQKIDRTLRGKGYPDRVQPQNISREINKMQTKLDEYRDSALAALRGNVMSIKVPCRTCGKAIEREMNEFAPKDNICDECKEGKNHNSDKEKDMSEISRLIMKVYLDLGIGVGNALDERIFFARIPPKYSQELEFGWSELVKLGYLEVKARMPVTLSLTQRGYEYLHPSDIELRDRESVVRSQNQAPKNNKLKLIRILYIAAAIFTILAGIVATLTYFNIFPFNKPASKDKKIVTNDIKTSNVSGDVVGRDKIVFQLVSSEHANQINIDKQSKIKLSKVEIERIIEDLSSEVNGIKREYFEGNKRIANDFSSRNISSSGMHIKAQMDFAISTKEKVEKLLTRAHRDIEDVLLRNFGVANLAEIDEFSEENRSLTELEKNRIPALYKQLENAVRSREARSLGEVHITKDFKL
jgi:hypothetical protein